MVTNVLSGLSTVGWFGVFPGFWKQAKRGPAPGEGGCLFHLLSWKSIKTWRAVICCHCITVAAGEFFLLSPLLSHFLPCHAHAAVPLGARHTESECNATASFSLGSNAAGWLRLLTIFLQTSRQPGQIHGNNSNLYSTYSTNVSNYDAIKRLVAAMMPCMELLLLATRTHMATLLNVDLADIWPVNHNISTLPYWMLISIC